MPWLPQPDAWRQLAADAQAHDGGSMLTLYRDALAIRRDGAYLAGDALEWLAAPGGVLAFSRGASFSCVVNITAEPVPLPPHDELLLTSAPLESGLLPPDAAAWLRARARAKPAAPLSQPGPDRPSGAAAA